MMMIKLNLLPGANFQLGLPGKMQHYGAEIFINFQELMSVLSVIKPKNVITWMGDRLGTKATNFDK